MYTRYPIVARLAWPTTACSAFRPSVSREQRYLAYKHDFIFHTFSQSLFSIIVDTNSIDMIHFISVLPSIFTSTKSIAVTKLFKLLCNNFALDKHALHYALCRL